MKYFNKKIKKMKLDNYELESLLAKGAFSEIYLANKKDDPQKYAIKKNRQRRIRERQMFKKIFDK